MMALAVISETDLIAALPRQLVAMHAARFGVVSTQAPLPLPLFQIRAIAPKVAMMDAGLAWLFEAMRDAVHINRPVRRRRRVN